jgi:hypothetical protein
MIPEVEGSNPAAGTGSDKMTRSLSITREVKIGKENALIK